MSNLHIRRLQRTPPPLEGPGGAARPIASPLVFGIAFSTLLAGDPAVATCPTCADTLISLDPAACGMWEAVPQCSQPVPNPQSGACPGGMWPAGLHAVHMMLLHTGKLLIWGNTHNDATGNKYSDLAHYWDPTGATANRTLQKTPQTTNQWINFECCGMVAKANGKALLVGGYDVYCSTSPPCAYVGHRAAYLFDPERFEVAGDDTTGWSRTADLKSRRYYATAAVLPDARVAAVSGERQPSAQAETLEVYYDGAGPSAVWTLIPSASKKEPEMQTYYPMIHVIPGASRRILSVGRNLTATNRMHLLDLDAATPVWGTSAIAAGFRAVNPTMYSGNKILRSVIPNGANTPIPTQEIITLQNGDVSAVSSAAGLQQGRIEFNSVALPDGNVLMIGGGKRPIGAVPGELQSKIDAVFRTELYRPAPTGTGETCKLAWMRHRDPDQGGPAIGVPRMYHSTALLLPDGKVLVAGGDVQDGCPNPSGFDPPDQHCISADYFKPPYLFTQTGQAIQSSHRPTLTSVPAQVAVGETFEPDLPALGSGATAIASVCLMRPGSTTHALDMDQRRLALAFTTPPGKIRITAPADLNQAPPGYYMLIAMNDGDNGGHPSVGQFVNLWGIPPTTLNVQVTQTCGSGSSSLTFAATFETTIRTGVDSLLIYSPANSNCGTLPALVHTAAAPANSTLHTIQKTTPCQTGTWRVQVRSSIGTSHAKSICKTIVVTCLSCCDPPCEFD